MEGEEDKGTHSIGLPRIVQREGDGKPAGRRIKASMKSLKMRIGEEDYLIRTEMKEKTQALFKKLGIKTPKRITKM